MFSEPCVSLIEMQDDRAMVERNLDRLVAPNRGYSDKFNTKSVAMMHRFERQAPQERSFSSRLQPQAYPCIFLLARLV